MEHQLSIRLPDETYDQLDGAARRLGMRRSQVIRRALDEFLERQTPGRPIDGVRHLAGSIRSGVSDLGSAHREHLIAMFKAEDDRRHAP